MDKKFKIGEVDTLSIGIDRPVKSTSSKVTLYINSWDIKSIEVERGKEKECLKELIDEL